MFPLFFLIFVSAIESSALAEKLLNDLLKTTEGFQRLKKINSDLEARGENKYVSKMAFT